MTRSLFPFFVLLFGVTTSVSTEEIVIDFTHPKFEQLDAEGKKLLSEYAKVYPKIKDFYENIRMDATVKRTHNSSEESLRSLRSRLESQGLSETEIGDVITRSRQSEKQYEVRYRRSDAYCRVDEKVPHPVTLSVRAKLPPEFSQQDFVQEAIVSLFTPTMEYQLSKNDPRKQYFSLSAKRDIRKPDVKGIAIEVMYFDRAPFSASGGTSLGELLFQCPPLVEGVPYSVIEYIRQNEVGGEQIVEIRLSSSWHLNSNPDDIAMTAK